MSAKVIRLREPAPRSEIDQVAPLGGPLGELLLAMRARDTRAWVAKHVGPDETRDGALRRVWRTAKHKPSVAHVAWMHRGYAPVLVQRHDGRCFCGRRKRLICVECCEVLRAECPCPTWGYLAQLVEGARTADVRYASARDLPRPGLRVIAGGAK